jgi:mannan endo-1,4-beta-mannosidase
MKLWKPIVSFLLIAAMLTTFQNGKRDDGNHSKAVPLCTPDASRQAVKVFEFLRKNVGKNMLSATMATVDWNTNEAEWVHQHTGKYPAMNCFDYLHLHSTTNRPNYEDVSILEQWWKCNGLVALVWHWNVPVEQGSKEYAFYAGNMKDRRLTTFDISKAVQEGTYENQVVKADMDKVADCLLLLKEKDIPVIWRPLHEASGGWFWWGVNGPEAYKALWKLMFDTFQKKGLNNLIWVWTSEEGDMDWYPGDTYVDIVGRDSYNKTNEEIASSYQRLSNEYPGKLVALSECGKVSTMSEQWQSGARWAWFMPWYCRSLTHDLHSEDFMGTAHSHADKSWWVDAVNQSFVVTRDRMPSLK